MAETSNVSPLPSIGTLRKASNGGMKRRTPGTGKAALEQIITDLGGYEAAARTTRTRAKSTLQTYTDHDADQQAPADVIESLTRASQNPAYGLFLLSLCDYVGVPVTPAQGCIQRFTGTLAEQHGKVLHHLIDAYLDGTMDKNEAAAAEPLLAALLEIIVSIRAECRRVAEEG